MHPGIDVPGRNGDAASDGDEQSAPDAHTGNDINAYAHAVDVRSGYGGSDGDAVADAHANADTDTRCITESRSRGTRVVRLGRDDRFGRVDLAAISQLTDSFHSRN